MIQVKRIYESSARGDGLRVLVDRLWPRGLSKDRARVDLWLREIAPSDELRKWFAHDPRRWAAFQKRYAAELKKKRALVRRLRELEKENKKITLLFSARDEQHNQAVALRRLLR